jgi:hypothetical protein
MRSWKRCAAPPHFRLSKRTQLDGRYSAIALPPANDILISINDDVCSLRHDDAAVAMILAFFPPSSASKWQLPVERAEVAAAQQIREAWFAGQDQQVSGCYPAMI